MAYQYKTQLPKCNIIYLNKHFEEKFEEELSRHCFLLSFFKIEIKDALEDFCLRHNISIDDDITYEALKKKEFRARKILEQNISKSDLEKPTIINPELFFQLDLFVYKKI